MQNGNPLRTGPSYEAASEAGRILRDWLARGIDDLLSKADTSFAADPAFQKLARIVRRATVADMERIMVAETIELLGPKYLSLGRMLERHVGRIKLLGFDKTEPSTILDLGGGAGYFAFAANAYGHRAVVLEPEDPLQTGVVLEAIYALLGVEATRQGVYRQQPLVQDAALSRKNGRPRLFDRVTSFATMWNYWSPAGQSYWDADDYRFLFVDLRRFMKPGAPFDFQPNGMLYGEPALTDTPSVTAHYHALGEWLRPLVVSHDGPTHITTLDIWRDIPAPVSLPMPLPEDLTPEASQRLFLQAWARRKELRRERERKGVRAPGGPPGFSSL